MRKTKHNKGTVFVLSALMLLASCGNTEISQSQVSSSLEDPTPDSSSTSTEEKVPVNKKLLADKFNQIAEAKSYRLKKVSLVEGSDEPSFEDVYDFERYVRLESKGISHIVRPNIEDPTKKSVYKFSHGGNALSLLSIDSKKTENGYVPLENLSSFNPLTEYLNAEGKGTFTNDDFLMNVDEYVVNDFALVYSLACMLNLKERAANEQFVYATIELEKSGDLSFTLVKSTDGFTFIDYAKGTFSDINSASSTLEENYFNAPVEVPLIEASSLPSLQKDSYAFTAEIWEHQDSVEWGYQEGTNVLEIDPTTIRHSYGYDEHFYQKRQDQSYEIRLSGANQTEEVPMNLPWSDYVYIKDVLSAKNLMKVAANHYRYVGSSPFSLFYGLTLAHSLGNQDVESIDFFLKGGLLSEVEVKFSSYTDPSNFYSKNWYAAHIKVAESPSITLPAPLLPLEDGSKADIEKTLSYFKGSFQLRLYNAQDPSSSAYLTYSNVPGNRYLLREEKVLKPGSMSEYDTKRTGYAYNKDNKLVHFLYTSQSDVFALEEPVAKELEDVLYMGLSPDLLKKTVIDGQPAYNLRAPIYDLTTSLQGYQHLEHARPMTFHMFYKNNVSKKPTSYRYRYEYNGGLSRGEEIGEFIGIGDDEIALDTALVSKVLNLTTFVEPSTWEMEQNVYPTLLSFFGEATAKSLPYVYEPTLFGEWYAITTNIVNGKPTRVSIYQPGTHLDFADPTDYMGRFTKKVQAIPGVIEGRDSKGRVTYYVSEGGVYTLGITIGDNPKEGIELYIPD